MHEGRQSVTKAGALPFISPSAKAALQLSSCLIICFLLTRCHIRRQTVTAAMICGESSKHFLERNEMPKAFLPSMIHRRDQNLARWAFKVAQYDKNRGLQGSTPWRGRHKSISCRQQAQAWYHTLVTKTSLYHYGLPVTCLAVAQEIDR